MTLIGRRTQFSIFLSLSICTNRWVYKRFFVADGNFKADHVRQHEDSDVWLSEGGGMFSKRADYREFLTSAIDRLTVCIPLNSFVADRQDDLCFRKPHVKINFGPLN